MYLLGPSSRELQERTSCGPVSSCSSITMACRSCSASEPVSFGWHYLSNASCLVRPHLFYAFFVVSMITILGSIIRHV